MKKYKIGDIVFPEHVDDIKNANEYLFDAHDRIDFSIFIKYHGYGMSYSEADLQRHLRLMTREFSVIAHAVGEMSGEYSVEGFALASSQADTNEESIENSPEERIKMQKIIKLFMNPILYVMTYSIMSLKNLSSINVYS
uniref:Uncharacterized protein n=1 Tax=Pithovirus LCPAC403 TaxID=2506596 RepID=A0A481ZAR2_9VIRU|nr:MAG: hypothetical protein LCPAC403_01380 [Pithovirus LCPAC403]